METGHYLKTELEHISVSDLDGEIQSEFQEKNLLRERTFNSELNSLVNKIFNNEIVNKEPYVFHEDLTPAEKNSLLERCEKIIYRLKHNDEINTLSSSYNPFDSDINIYDDIDDTADYIKAGLFQCGYKRYQVLKYNFHDKSYRSDINFLDSSFSSDMYFSIKDPVFLKINEITEGFVISSNLINSEPFLLKKFSNKNTDSKKISSYYIVKITGFFNDLNFISNKKNTFSRFDDFLSPLLLIELEDNNMVNSDELFNICRKNTAIPFMLYFLKNRIKLNMQSRNYDDTLLMLELFLESSTDSELKGYVINLKNYSMKDNIFILKFFLSKVRRILKKNSLILRVNINIIVLFTTEAEAESVGNILERMNSGEDVISIKSFDNNEYLRSKEFVHLFL